MPASAKLEFLGEELAALYDSLSEEEKKLAWLNFEGTTELFGIGGPATRSEAVPVRHQRCDRSCEHKTKRRTDMQTKRKRDPMLSMRCYEHGWDPAEDINVDEDGQITSASLTYEATRDLY